MAPGSVPSRPPPPPHAAATPAAMAGPQVRGGANVMEPWSAAAAAADRDREDPRTWSEAQLGAWLSSRGLPLEISRAFEEHLVNGLLGVDIDLTDLTSMGIHDAMHQRRVLLELGTLFGERRAASARERQGSTTPAGGLCGEPPAPSHMSSMAALPSSVLDEAAPQPPMSQQPRRPTRPLSARSAGASSSAVSVSTESGMPSQQRPSPYASAVPWPPGRRPRPRSAHAAPVSANHGPSPEQLAPTPQLQSQLHQQQQQQQHRHSHFVQHQQQPRPGTSYGAPAAPPTPLLGSRGCGGGHTTPPTPVQPRRPPPQVNVFPCRPSSARSYSSSTPRRIGSPGFERYERGDRFASQARSLRDGSLVSLSASLSSARARADGSVDATAAASSAHTAREEQQGCVDGAVELEASCRQLQAQLDAVLRERDALRAELHAAESRCVAQAEAAGAQLAELRGERDWLRRELQKLLERGSAQMESLHAPRSLARLPAEEADQQDAYLTYREFMHCSGNTSARTQRPPAQPQPRWPGEAAALQPPAPRRSRSAMEMDCGFAGCSSSRELAPESSQPHLIPESAPEPSSYVGSAALMATMPARLPEPNANGQAAVNVASLLAPPEAAPETVASTSGEPLCSGYLHLHPGLDRLSQSRAFAGSRSEYGHLSTSAQAGDSPCSVAQACEPQRPRPPLRPAAAVADAARLQRESLKATEEEAADPAEAEVAKSVAIIAEAAVQAACRPARPQDEEASGTPPPERAAP